MAAGILLFLPLLYSWSLRNLRAVSRLALDGSVPLECERATTFTEPKSLCVCVTGRGRVSEWRVSESE